MLVTNALQYLPHADQVVWIEDGVVKAVGSYAQLVERGLNIAELVHMEDEQGKADEANELKESAEEEKAASSGASTSGSAGGASGSGSREASEAGDAADGAAGAPPAARVAANASIVLATPAVSKGADGKGGELAAVAAPATKPVLARNASSVMAHYTPQGKVTRSITMSRLQTEANRNLTGIEARESGNVSADVYKRYMIAGGGAAVAMLIVALFALEQVRAGGVVIEGLLWLRGCPGRAAPPG